MLIFKKSLRYGLLLTFAGMSAISLSHWPWPRARLCHRSIVLRTTVDLKPILTPYPGNPRISQA